MTMKYNQDYTVCKFPVDDPYAHNYEIFGQGRYNGCYKSFWAESRAEAMVEARAIAKQWEDAMRVCIDLASNGF